jgi:hypothetical protein
VGQRLPEEQACCRDHGRVERQPLQKIEPDANDLLKLLRRWRKEAEAAGNNIKRIAVSFETGRDAFWLSRWRRPRQRPMSSTPLRHRPRQQGLGQLVTKEARWRWPKDTSKLIPFVCIFIA